MVGPTHHTAFDSDKAGDWIDGAPTFNVCTIVTKPRSFANVLPPRYGMHIRCSLNNNRRSLRLYRRGCAWRAAFAAALHLSWEQGYWMSENITAEVEGRIMLEIAQLTEGEKGTCVPKWL